MTFRLPHPVSDDAEAPDEFRMVLHTRERWWRAGNGFHLTLRAALHAEFVSPVLRAVYWPYVTLAERYGRFDVLYVARDRHIPHLWAWQHWSRHFTHAGARRRMDRSTEAFRNTEMKVVARDG